MANNIETAWVEEYKNAVYENVQVMGGAFLGKTREESIGGEAQNYETLSAIYADVAGARFSDTPIADVNHGRRKVYPVDLEVGNMIDNWDAVKTLVDFRGPYVMQQAYGLLRKRDIQVFKGALGTAATETGGVPGSAVFDFTGQSIDITLGATAGNAGLNVQKLRAARTKLKQAGYNPNDPGQKFYMAVNPKQMDDLLASTEVTSSDFNSVKALVHGEIDQFLGFTFIESNLVPYVNTVVSDLPTSIALDWSATDMPVDTAGNEIRGCFAYVKDSLVCATNPEMSSSIDIRVDKRNNWQAYSKLGFGAVRMEEAGVVLIGCDETV